MKKIIIIIVLFSSFGVFAQKEVAKKVNELLVQKVVFKHYSVLTPTKPDLDVSRKGVVDQATFAKIKMETLADIAATKPENIEVEIPYQGGIIDVQLYKVNLFSEAFHLDTDKSKSISYQKGVYYRGIMKGDSNSLVSFSFFKNELNGTISSTRLNNLVIGKLNRKDNVSDYIIYSDQNLKVPNNTECHTEDNVSQAINKHINKSTEKKSTKCVAMYFEMDNDLFLANSSDITTTTNWMTSVFNNVQTLYANDGIAVAIKSVYIWTEKDPYTGLKSSAYMYKFHTVRPLFDGDVGQLIGIDPGDLGGVAITVNGLCSDKKFCYSDVNFSFESVPTFSWTVMVITHEMGHLLGSEHTHACFWNGNNTPIDNCAPFKKGPNTEGYSCLTTPPTLPSTTEGGTIMSYCHLISEIGINFANGFGPQPAAAILEAVNGGDCLSSDCINTCYNTASEIKASNITNTSATISWKELGSAVNWQISVVPVTSNTPVWVSVETTSYDVSDLLPNTYYKASVRPKCEFDVEAPQIETFFVTDANYCNGAILTDTGGETGDYSNSENYIRTIIPNVANNKIKLNFTAFDLEKDYDYLFVYDGNTKNAPDLSAGGFTGSTLPGSFISTAADGSLTIEFFSDDNTVSSGYVANVSCESTLGNKNFIPNIDFTYSPNPTNGLVSISSKTQIDEVLVYNLEGRLLYQNKIKGLNTKVDMTPFAMGTYFFKLKFNEKEVNFKILRK